MHMNTEDVEGLNFSFSQSFILLRQGLLGPWSQAWTASKPGQLCLYHLQSWGYSHMAVTFYMVSEIQTQVLMLIQQNILID